MNRHHKLESSVLKHAYRLYLRNETKWIQGYMNLFELLQIIFKWDFSWSLWCFFSCIPHTQVEQIWRAWEGSHHILRAWEGSHHILFHYCENDNICLFILSILSSKRILYILGILIEVTQKRSHTMDHL